jgi:hypothetical protein
MRALIQCKEIPSHDKLEEIAKKAKLEGSIRENASSGNLVNQVLKSVVREIRTPRSEGVGAVQIAPSTRLGDMQIAPSTRRGPQ